MSFDLSSKSSKSSSQDEDADEVEFKSRKSERNKKSNSPNSLLKRTRSGRCVKFNTEYSEKYAKKQQRQNMYYQVKKALDKPVEERSKDDADLLDNCKDLVVHADLCRQNRILAAKQQEIIVDDAKTLELKCTELAEAIRNSKCCMVYTGAGISTSASIPDYRGPNGLWTLLEKGVKVDLPDFSLVEPTFSHMALNAMMEMKLIEHVVSQNCDGLHVRSGMDRTKLSELHGNCFVEFCPECFTEYVRLFDVTEKTTFRKHITGRYCYSCKKNPAKNENINSDETSKDRYQLRDSIIHFGEKLRNGSPFNWETARETLKDTDLIICFGSSLKVLKHYACLWPKKKSVSLYIVNIQYTPKDKFAKTKIHGYCDDVLKLVIKHLQKTDYPTLKVNNYSIRNDPLFQIAVKLTDYELETTTKLHLSQNKSKLSTSKREKSATSSLLELEDESNDSKKAASTGNSWFTKSFKARKSNVKS